MLTREAPGRRKRTHGPSLLNSAMVVLFLLLAVVAQSYTAFRGRRGDRRGEDGAFNRRASDRQGSAADRAPETPAAA